MTLDVARLFDRLADDYDTFEPWSEHLYAQLARFARTSLGTHPPGATALDAGCGTGLHFALLRDLGFTVHGTDLSAGLLAVARARRRDTPLVRADLERLPYRDGCFDAVLCCGSTLNFVTSPARALAELARVLRPGGRLLLESEHKWNLDLAWMLASALAGDPLGYGLTPASAWRQLARPLGQGFRLDYPTVLPDGAGTTFPLRVLTMAELDQWLRDAGLVIARTWGVHAVTNVIPSIVLHRPALPAPLGALYRMLRAADRALARVAWRAANSLVILATRPGAPHRGNASSAARNTASVRSTSASVCAHDT